MVTADQLIHFSPRFQRAINVRYDLNDSDAVERYIPTTTSVNAIKAILQGTNSYAVQRAHILHAAYGSGKSLFAVTLAGLLEKREELLPSLQHVASHIAEIDTEIGLLVDEYLGSGIKLLPVVLSGNEGDFASAILRSLIRTLKEHGLDDIKPESRFERAIHTMEYWASDYPDAFDQFANLLLNDLGDTVETFAAALTEHDTSAFEEFESLYTRLTAGAVFDYFDEQSPEVAFDEVAGFLPQYGFQGIVVLWDEFGRYLDGRTTHAFSTEASLLQNFAELCNSSGEHQLHFLLFAHKELQSYASNLPKTYQQEWSRIEGRFLRHDVTTDPYVSYRLITSALRHIDSNYIQALVPQAMAAQTLDARLFGVLPIEDVRTLVSKLWPLHPLSAYSLTRLSNRVAQNERTMFTFLTADEPRALKSILADRTFSEDSDSFVRLDKLWDYFEDAIRADTGSAHEIWSGVTYALDKVAPGDVLSEILVKTLGILLISSESTIAKPTTELLYWALDAQTDEQKSAVIGALDNLSRRKVIIKRSIDGYWSFAAGSDVDFERQLTDILERTNPTHLQLRRLLEQLIPPPISLARRYNQDHAITRFFTGMYRWAHELVDAPWHLQMEQMQNTDGLVVYVLATSELELEQAKSAIQSDERVVYVLPLSPMQTLVDALREWFGLHELSNDPILRQHEDQKRIQRELEWLIEDAQVRVQRELSELVDARQSKVVWVAVKDKLAIAYIVNSTSQTTILISEICRSVFSDTPVFISEGLNRHQPTTQQIRAAEKLIDAMLLNDPSPTFGLEGSGPEILALNSLLRLPGILRPVNDIEWIVSRPQEADNALSGIWDLIAAYLHGEKVAPIEPLITQLMAPPFGLRRGILPVLLVAALYNDLKVTTIRRDNRPIHPISGELVTDMVFHPSQYSIEIGEWNETLERVWRAVISRFGNHILDTEKRQQPMVILQVSMLRWLQALPQYCKQTQQISSDALAFRNLIRAAQTEPSKTLFTDLPQLLGAVTDSSQADIEARLDSLMSEISNAYIDLQRRLDAFTIKEFGRHSVTPVQDGATAMYAWIDAIQAESGTAVTQLRFGSLITQELVETVLTSRSVNGRFWDDLSTAIMGVHLRDWNDQTETKFYNTLTRAQAEVEREVQELVAEEEVVAITIQLPDETQREYRFRSSDLSVHGKRILQNFKSTMDISGRPLSADERRQIAVAFLFHMMGDSIEA